HEDVGQCVVTVVPDRGEIAAFVVPTAGRSVAVTALQSHAASLLPAHMLPATVTVLDHIPTFVHGKIDFGALLSRIDRSGGADTPSVVAPADELEARVALIYSQMLGRAAVSVTESSFLVCGLSALAF